MGPVTLRCRLCGARASVQLDEFQRRTLDLQNYVARVCRHCGGTTDWEPAAATGAARMADSAPVSGPRVLLIDDDESILKIIGKALSGCDCDVETASSARDAAMLLARADYDIILSDIRMPDFDGTQLFEFLDRHLPEYKKRVVFLTGDTGTPSTMEFLEKSGAPYLTKPVDIPTLFQLVKKTNSAASGSES